MKILKNEARILLLLFVFAVFFTSCRKHSEKVEYQITPTIMVNQQNPDAKNGEVTISPTMMEITNIPSPTAEAVIFPDIQYESIYIKNKVTVEYKENHGISIDLNGDGCEEQIYIYKEKLYLNGILNDDVQLDAFYWEKDLESCWLIDIDKEDRLIELLTLSTTDDSINVWHYIDSFQLIGSFMANTQKRICDATFHDNNLISFLYRADILEHITLEFNFYLDTDGKLSIQPGDYRIDDNKTLTLLKEIKLFSKKDLNGDYIIAKPQIVTLKITDGSHWTYVVGEEGAKGWIYSEKVGTTTIVNKESDKNDYFEGFDTAG